MNYSQVYSGFIPYVVCKPRSTVARTRNFVFFSSTMSKSRLRLHQLSLGNVKSVCKIYLRKEVFLLPWIFIVRKKKTKLSHVSSFPFFIRISSYIFFFFGIIDFFFYCYDSWSKVYFWHCGFVSCECYWSKFLKDYILFKLHSKILSLSNFFSISFSEDLFYMICIYTQIHLTCLLKNSGN